MSRRSPKRTYRRFAPPPWSVPFATAPGWPYAGRPWDPEDDLNAPELEDPEDDLNAPELEDPEDDLNAPELEDPDFGRFYGPWPYAAGAPYFPGGGFFPGACPPSTAQCSTQAACDEQASPASGLAEGIEGEAARLAYSGFVIVRLHDGKSPDGHENLHHLARCEGFEGLRRLLELRLDGESLAPTPVVLDSWPLIGHQDPDPAIPLYDVIRSLEARAATTTLPPLYSLLSYWRVDLRPYPERVPEIVERLNSLPEVDAAYRELAASDPGSLPPELPDSEASPMGFDGHQDYLDDAPVGIGARWAWDWLPQNSSDKVRVVDLEQRWMLDHENLPALKGEQPLFGDNRAAVDENPNHGTAVCGQLNAERTPTADLEGIATRVARLKVASHYIAELGFNGHVAAAIIHLVAGKPEGFLVAGDVLVLEVQRSFLPTEVDSADFDAIRLASALGITVFEAAGNGGYNLDTWRDPWGRRALRRGSARFRESGAVLVGAAHAVLPHNRTPSSNYGCRIDVYGWGDNVLTCGYGDFYAGTGKNQHLTDTFKGTSAATPCAAGAGILLQAIYRHNVGGDSALTPLHMRRILSDPSTGTPQGPGRRGFIGVMPNLCKILTEGLGLVPSPYLRRDPCDDGSRPSHTEICQSHEIFVRPSPNVPPSFETGGAREHTPAPGMGEVDECNVFAFVRVRNRGLCDAEHVCARVYRSEAATLITPDMWSLIGETSMAKPIPQGGSLVVSPALPWSPDPPTARHHSYLAVVAAGTADHCEVPPIPNGSVCFDWQTYLDFLRAEHVACRNVHKIKIPKGATQAGQEIQANFFFTGMSDSARKFDFEIVQKLPKGVKATLELKLPLALKLRRRLHWTSEASTTDPTLELPANPSLLFRRIRLPRAARLRSTLTFSGTLEDLETGHGLIIKQFYKGDLVGRIAWHLMIRNP